MYYEEPRPHQLFVREKGISDNSRGHNNEPISVPGLELSSGRVYMAMAASHGFTNHQMLKAAVSYIKEDSNYQGASDILWNIMYDSIRTNPKLYACAAVLYQLSSHLEAFEEGKISDYELTSRLSVGVWDQIDYNVSEEILSDKESDALVELVRGLLEEYEVVAFNHVDI